MLIRLQIILGYVWPVRFANGKSVALADVQSAFEGQMLTVFDSVQRLFSDYIK